MSSFERAMLDKTKYSLREYIDPVTKELKFYSEPPDLSENTDDMVMDYDTYLQEDVKPIWDKLIEALAYDCCNEFVEILKNERRTGTLRYNNVSLTPAYIMYLTIIFDALRCTEALLSGAVGEPADVDVTLTPYIESPVYQAVTTLNPELLDLLLNYGARLDIPCRSLNSEYYSLLPMEAALKAISEKVLWTQNQSVYELTCTLWSSAELKRGLIAVGRLMKELPVEQTRNAIYQNAREGKIVYLAILLYSDAISNLGVFKGLEDMYLGLSQSSAACAMSSPANVGDGVSLSETEKHTRESLLSLLDLFIHTDFSKLGVYTAFGLFEKRIRNAGFELTNLQNMGYVRAGKGILDDNNIQASESITNTNTESELTIPEPQEETRVMDRTIHKADWPQGVNAFTKWMEMGQDRMVLARNVHRKHPFTCSSARTFEALQSFWPISKLYTAAGPVAQGSITKASHQLAKCSLGRTWSIASAFRRVVHL